jgi:uncharacterized protein DUF5989
MSFAREFLSFVRVRKKFWLAPIFVAMLLLGGFLVFIKGSAVAPFMYTFF